MKASTLKLIDEYIDIICSDHHKTRDGCFEIVNYYNAWDKRHYWYVNHPGYINEIEAKGMYGTPEEAEDYLVDKLNDWIPAERENRFNEDGTLKPVDW